jgi:ribosome-associated protein
LTEETEPRPAGFTAEIPAAVSGVMEVLDKNKGEDIVLLDMREVSGFTDFMVLCSGRSETHVRALIDAVGRLRREQGAKPAHIEGRAEGNWVLMDFFDLIVHVFTTDSREFYQLERLWRDAPMQEWKGEGAPSA